MKRVSMAALLMILGLTALNAAPLEDLSGGQTGRIEFQSINAPSMWEFARKNTSNTRAQTVWGDLLMPKTC